MCGRFALSLSRQDYENRIYADFGVNLNISYNCNWQTSYNVSPTYSIPVILSGK